MIDQKDETLLAQLAHDVDRSYEALIAKYIHQLYSFALRRTENKQDAEDIVQETFMRALSALRSYPAQRIYALRLRPWLYKIAYHVYLNHVERHTPPSFVLLDTPEDESLLDIEDEQAEQPEVVAELRERRQELEDLVGTLPPKPREAIRLHFFEELSYDEMTVVLDHNYGTLRFHVHRGLRRLRQALDKEHMKWGA